MTKVQDVMTTTILTVKMNTPFHQAVHALTRSKFQHLPVVNNDGSLRAIITASDMLNAMHELDQFANQLHGFSIEKKLNVRDEMTSDVISLTVDSDINDAIALIAKHNLHALPVLDGEDLVGIVTSNDIIRALHAKNTEGI